MNRHPLDFGKHSLADAQRFWDAIPKYTHGDRVYPDDIPNAMTSAFDYEGRAFRVTQTPGLYKDLEDKWVPAYPGHREQVVENALRSLDTSTGVVARDRDGVRFPMFALRHSLETLGYSYSSEEIVNAIELLKGSSLSVSTADDKARAQRSIIMSYSTTAPRSPDGSYSPDHLWWYVEINPFF